MTFLDLVRRIGELTTNACLPECSQHVHREEAARVLGILYANPELIDNIAAAAERYARRKETP